MRMANRGLQQCALRGLYGRKIMRENRLLGGFKEVSENDN